MQFKVQCAADSDIMDLMCYEPGSDYRAYPDPVLLNDERVLQNLLQMEERYCPSSSYFECVQTNLTPKMRTVVAEWMMEVSLKKFILTSNCVS